MIGLRVFLIILLEILSDPFIDHHTDMLWILQVDSILEFEKQIAPFLGAMEEVRNIVRIM